LYFTTFQKQQQQQQLSSLSQISSLDLRSHIEAWKERVKGRKEMDAGNPLPLNSSPLPLPNKSVHQTRCRNLTYQQPTVATGTNDPKPTSSRRISPAC